MTDAVLAALLDTFDAVIVRGDLPPLIPLAVERETGQGRPVFCTCGEVKFPVLHDTGRLSHYACLRCRPRQCRAIPR